MIETGQQYQVAKEQAARLESGLKRLAVRGPGTPEIDPLLLEMERDDVRDILAELYEEIAEYESGQRQRTTSAGDRLANRLPT